MEEGEGGGCQINDVLPWQSEKAYEFAKWDGVMSI